MGKRKLAMAFSLSLIAIAIIALAMRGLSLGIDFTGGYLIEMQYEHSVDLRNIRKSLSEGGFGDAQVQHFGAASDVLVRIAPRDNINRADLSSKVLINPRAEVQAYLRAPHTPESILNSVRKTQAFFDN